MGKNSLVIIFLVLFSTTLAAEDRVITERIILSFIPKSASLIYWSEDHPINVKEAELLEADIIGDDSHLKQKTWYVGGVASDFKDPHGLTALFYIEGDDEYIITPQQYVVLNDVSGDSLNLLKRSAQLTQEVWELQNEARKTEASLRSIKDEIGVIGDLDHIVSVREEQKRYKAQLESVRQEEVALKDSLIVLKAALKPVQYARRELELMRANSELSVKSIPYALEQRKIESRRKKDYTELQKLEKKFSKVDVSRLEEKLKKLKVKGEGKPF